MIGCGDKRRDDAADDAANSGVRVSGVVAVVVVAVLVVVVVVPVAVEVAVAAAAATAAGGLLAAVVVVVAVAVAAIVIAPASSFGSTLDGSGVGQARKYVRGEEEHMGGGQGSTPPRKGDTARGLSNKAPKTPRRWTIAVAAEASSFP